ncbi:hypothetical protein EYF80_055709 [Liparis tanakae]|uniref:Uncharacterized protein n=1 Tax=Liparis tanakae TaxID=230148 RepID=A0A4Z2EYS3_9TELE|nr:hypothetical protein EYF80_055709 [Liparis tanakae]
MKERRGCCEDEGEEDKGEEIFRRRMLPVLSCQRRIFQTSPRLRSVSRWNWSSPPRWKAPPLRRWRAPLWVAPYRRTPTFAVVPEGGGDRVRERTRARLHQNPVAVRTGPAAQRHLAETHAVQVVQLVGDEPDQQWPEALAAPAPLRRAVVAAQRAEDARRHEDGAAAQRRGQVDGEGPVRPVRPVRPVQTAAEGKCVKRFFIYVRRRKELQKRLTVESGRRSPPRRRSQPRGREATPSPGRRRPAPRSSLLSSPVPDSLEELL